MLLLIRNLATNASLSAVEYKIPSVSHLVNKTDFDNKITGFNKRCNLIKIKHVLY